MSGFLDSGVLLSNIGRKFLRMINDLYSQFYFKSLTWLLLLLGHDTIRWFDLARSRQGVCSSVKPLPIKPAMLTSRWSNLTNKNFLPSKIQLNPFHNQIAMRYHSFVYELACAVSYEESRIFEGKCSFLNAWGGVLMNSRKENRHPCLIGVQWFLT